MQTRNCNLDKEVFNVRTKLKNIKQHYEKKLKLDAATIADLTKCNDDLSAALKLKNTPEEHVEIISDDKYLLVIEQLKRQNEEQQTKIHSLLTEVNKLKLQNVQQLVQFNDKIRLTEINEDRIKNKVDAQRKKLLDDELLIKELEVDKTLLLEKINQLEIVQSLKIPALINLLQHNDFMKDLPEKQDEVPDVLIKDEKIERFCEIESSSHVNRMPSPVNKFIHFIILIYF